MSQTDFGERIQEAQNAVFKGWDFAFVAERMVEEPLPWDYKHAVLQHLPQATCLLDMGTGGGEFLSALTPLPAHTYATEAYPPNIPIAAQRLEPLGVKVVPLTEDRPLPFEDRYFDLIINRHESFAAEELHRILQPEGRFITQQVGLENNIELNTFFGDDHWKDDVWNLECAVKQLQDQHFEIVEQHEAFVNTHFYDIGAIVYYLKAIPWQIPDFSVEGERARLQDLHDLICREGRFTTYAHRFFLLAQKKDSLWV